MCLRVCHVSTHLRWDNGVAQMTQVDVLDGQLPKVKEMGNESDEK